MDLNDIDTLVESSDSKYSLCIALAKRSRELGAYITAKRNMERVNIIPPLVEANTNDPLEIAIQELKENKVDNILALNSQVVKEVFVKAPETPPPPRGARARRDRRRSRA